VGTVEKRRVKSEERKVKSEERKVKSEERKVIRKQQTDDPLGSPRVGESCHKVTERGRSVLPPLCKGRWHLAAEVRRLVSIRAPHPRVGSDSLIAPFSPLAQGSLYRKEI
jgi:hypothetical protein